MKRARGPVEVGPSWTGLRSGGLIIREGTLADATVIEARAGPSRAKKGKAGSVDPDAGFTKKHGRAVSGSGYISGPIRVQT